MVFLPAAHVGREFYLKTVRIGKSKLGAGRRSRFGYNREETIVAENKISNNLQNGNRWSGSESC